MTPCSCRFWFSVLPRALDTADAVKKVRSFVVIAKMPLPKKLPSSHAVIGSYLSSPVRAFGWAAARQFASPFHTLGLNCSQLDLVHVHGLHSSTQRKRAHLAESMADVARIKFSIEAKKRKGWYLL